jgi:hypothetical protein
VGDRASIGAERWRDPAGYNTRSGHPELVPTSVWYGVATQPQASASTDHDKLCWFPTAFPVLMAWDRGEWILFDNGLELDKAPGFRTNGQ